MMSGKQQALQLVEKINASPSGFTLITYNDAQILADELENMEFSLMCFLCPDTDPPKSPFMCEHIASAFFSVRDLPDVQSLFGAEGCIIEQTMYEENDTRILGYPHDILSIGASVDALNVYGNDWIQVDCDVYVRDLIAIRCIKESKPIE